MDLKAAVERYLEVVKEFGHPMPLSRFELPREEIEDTVSGWDEDYHLHRHFVLIPASPAGSDEIMSEAKTGTGGKTGKETSYSINGLSCTAIVFRESIRHALE